MSLPINRNIAHVIWYLFSMPVTYSQNYVLIPEALTFAEADAACLSRYGQHLASIHSANDQTEATTVADGHDVFLGLTDAASEGTWVNLDGTAWDYGNIINPTGTFPWNANEPNNAGGEHCAHISQAVANGAWNDISCDNTFYFLCNVPRDIFDDPSWYSRKPSLGTQIGTIDVLDEFFIEFDFEVHSWPGVSAFQNIFHIGNIDGERYPAIYTYTDGGGGHKIHSAFGVIGNWSPSKDSGAISAGIHHYDLHQTQDYLWIYIDSVAVYDGYSDTHPIVFNRPVWFSADFGLGAADVTVTNLVMRSNNLHVPNDFEYTCQTTQRFTVIRGDWTMTDPDGIDGCWGFRQDTDSAEGAVVWLGDNDPSSLDWTDYTVEVDIKVTDANNAGQAGLFVRAQTVCDGNDCGQQYWVAIDIDNNAVKLGWMDNGWNQIQSYALSNIGVTLEVKTYYALKVEVSGATFKVYFNDQRVFTETRSPLEYDKGSVGLRTYQARARFNHLRIIFPSDNQLITVEPTTSPTNYPTTQPTTQPTTSPTTKEPTTIQPTFDPTHIPTYYPTFEPTTHPTIQPTYYPTYYPTFIPTYVPTSDPTSDPTFDPTTDPTTDPTSVPSNIPTDRPTKTPTKNPVTENVIPTTVTVSAGVTEGGFNDGTQNGLLGFSAQEMILVAILGSAILIVLLCICIICCYWSRKKGKDAGNNIELTEVVPSSPSTELEGNGTDLTGATTTGGKGMNAMMRINSMSAAERDGNVTTEPGAEPDLLDEEPVVPAENNQQFMPMNPMGMGMSMMQQQLIQQQMMQMQMQNEVMSVAMSMPNINNMMPNVMNMTAGTQSNQSNVNVGYGVATTQGATPVGNVNETNEEQQQNHDENDEEYEYYYEEDEEEQDDVLYGKGGNNATSAGQ